ncbi:MAG TPA: MFS transporter, partial [Planctomycetota bacterium]|nr:MFS transporter [Planctomycetota bacterium]
MAASFAPAVASARELPPAQERVAVAALALAAFALNLNTNVMGPLQQFMPAATLPYGQHSFGWMVAAAALGSAIGALLSGPWIDRTGRRRPLLYGMLAFVVISALHCVVSGFIALLVLRAASGVVVGIAYASASTLAAELVPYQRRARTMGIFTAGMFLAIPVGLPLANLLAQAGHWQGIFLVQAVFGALGLWFAWRAVPADAGAAAWIAPWRLLGRLPVAAALAAVLLHVGSFFTTVQLASGWLDRPNLVPKEQQQWLWIVLGLACAAGSFVFGGVADRFGKRNFVLASSVALFVSLIGLVGASTLPVVASLGLLLAV